MHITHSNLLLRKKPPGDVTDPQPYCFCFLPSQIVWNNPFFSPKYQASLEAHSLSREPLLSPRVTYRKSWKDRLSKELGPALVGGAALAGAKQ
jgi:hypothetical protein